MNVFRFFISQVVAIIFYKFAYSYEKLDNNLTYSNLEEPFIMDDVNDKHKYNNLTHIIHNNLYNLMAINGPMETMYYHRKMMNAFKVSNFLANEISKLLNVEKNNQLKDEMHRRLGPNFDKNVSFNGEDQQTPFKQNIVFSNHNLLNDIGSTEYTAWLNRLATGSRIKNYLQYNTGKNRIKDNFQPLYDYESINDMGNVYDYSNDSFNDANYGLYLDTQDTKRNLKRNINKIGYDSMHNINHNQIMEHSFEHNDISNRLKEVTLKDVVAVAFTTLGFLSFGMIILQILMCITMNKDDFNNNNMMMTPMENVDTDTEEVRRKRRSVGDEEKTNKVAFVNEIARKMLIVIEMYSPKERDDGKPCGNTKNSNYEFIIGKIMQTLYMNFWK